MKIIIFLLSIGCLSGFSSNAKTQDGLMKQSFLVDAKLRSYWVYIPQAEVPTSGFPVLFALHGGGGNAKATAKNTRFHQTSHAKNWIVVYPQATRHRFKSNWNDGRVHTQKGKEHFATIDDVKYILTILEKLKHKYPIDTNRIYATGVSNGAYMSQRLAVEHAVTFAAIATVIGSMSELVEEKFPPVDHVSVLMINGTNDPLVPYRGGMAKFGKKDLGVSLPIEKVVRIWASHNDLIVKPQIDYLPDLDPNDNCKIERRIYSKPHENSEIILLKLHGTGHTIPGNKQYAPVKHIGYTCYDINASDYIVEFLNKH